MTKHDKPKAKRKPSPKVSHWTGGTRPKWAEDLVAAMDRHEFSGAKLSAALGISERPVWHWRRGSKRPHRLLIPALRKLLPSWKMPKEWDRRPAA